MLHLTTIALFVLTLSWVTQAVLSALQVRKTWMSFVVRSRDRFSAFRPRASVIVPFRGVEPGLEEHLRGLFEQDYPDYELVFVVESKNDPAHAVLTQTLGRYPNRRAVVLEAGPCGENEGQKVHNQIRAIDYLLSDKNSRAIAGPGDPFRGWVWVFADSDAVPGRRWLADLVGPLGRKNVGLSFGYRWLVPADKANRGGLWTALASVMNSSVACFYKTDAFNHAWGGSMAVLAQTALRGGLRGRLVGALCDDYQFSRMCRELGLRLYFVPWCLVATPVDFTFAQMVNFAHRQYLLTRVYAPKLYAGAVLVTTGYVAGMAATWGWLLRTVTVGPGWTVWEWAALAWLGLVLVAVFTANQLRAMYRKRVIQAAFGRGVLEQLQGVLRWDRWATPVWMTLHWLLILRSGVGRVMRWRGISYRLLGPQRVIRLSAAGRPPVIS